jgi:hypothetical protein
MNIALAIEDNHKCYNDLDLENETRFASSVRNLCGFFVSVADQKAYLIHQTAKEFLISNGEALTGRWKHSLNSVESELVVASVCITYLNFIGFDSQLNSRTLDEHDFFRYAASFWATHFRQAQSRATGGLLQSVLQILRYSEPTIPELDFRILENYGAT